MCDRRKNILNYQDVIDHAFAVLKNAYAPYSGLHVGACLKMQDGTYICGVNVENASYGLSNCAERSAIFSAISQGYRKQDIVSMAIVSDATHIITPCGACRQVLVECMLPKTPIILSDKVNTIETNIADLMPQSFTQEDLT